MTNLQINYEIIITIIIIYTLFTVVYLSYYLMSRQYDISFVFRCNYFNFININISVYPLLENGADHCLYQGQIYTFGQTFEKGCKLCWCSVYGKVNCNKGMCEHHKPRKFELNLSIYLKIRFLYFLPNRLVTFLQ